jgi:uncharacterized protein (DUF3820 family)
MYITPFTDSDVMPFGQHKGKKMANVPAPYLLYIYNKGWCYHEGVKKYITDNLDTLTKEANSIPKKY